MRLGKLWLCNQLESNENNQIVCAVFYSARVWELFLAHDTWMIMIVRVCDESKKGSRYLQSTIIFGCLFIRVVGETSIRFLACICLTWTAKNMSETCVCVAVLFVESNLCGICHGDAELFSIWYSFNHQSITLHVYDCKKYSQNNIGNYYRTGIKDAYWLWSKALNILDNYDTQFCFAFKVNSKEFSRVCFAKWNNIFFNILPF